MDISSRSVTELRTYAQASLDRNEDVLSPNAVSQNRMPGSPSDDNSAMLLEAEHVLNSLQCKADNSDPSVPIANSSPNISQSFWQLMLWKTEVLCWCGSLGIFSISVAVLRVLDHRSLPNLRFGITPNAIIGFLATITQGLLMTSVSSSLGQIKWLQAQKAQPVYNIHIIDQASRGPMGSFWLLWSRRGGWTASLGAAITILSIGSVNFFQQALQYKTNYGYYSDDVNCSIPIAQDLKGEGSVSYADGGGDFIMPLDNALRSAPSLALYSSPNTTFNVEARCSTGNCTWDWYHTLSVCNTCNDITTEINQSSRNVDSYFTANDGSKFYFALTNDYLLSKGIQLTGLSDQSDSMDYVKVMGLPYFSVDEHFFAAEPSNVTSIPFSGNISRILSVFAIGPSPGTIPFQTYPDPESGQTIPKGAPQAPPIAFECVLQFCVRNMTAKFTNGTLNETVHDEWYDTSQAVSMANPAILQQNGSDNYFTVSTKAFSGLATWLSLIYLNGSVQGFPNTYWQPGTPWWHASPDPIGQIFAQMNASSEGFPSLMDNLARSLSTSMRKIPSQPRPLIGKAFYPITRAEVSWEWLILPVVQIFAGLIFLIAVIHQSNRSSQVPWANNILALLFHGLDERPTADHGYKTQRDMENEARQLVVEFQASENGGNLVSTTTSGIGG